MIGPVRGAAAGTKDTAIFVANQFDVTAYPAHSNGDVAPIALTTDMATPTSFARDAGGRIYVTNFATNTVTVYAANANGNVPPLAVIGGANTQLVNPTGIALDAGGKIYVLNSEVDGKASITVYPPLETGTGILNEAPVTSIEGSKTLLEVPFGVALDSQGNIYVANAEGGRNARHERYGPGSITVYPARSNGNVAPVATISGAETGLSYPIGIALDSSRNIYVANGDNGYSITVYQAGSNGNAAPIAVISGDNTGIYYPRGIALDSSGNLYVSGYINGVGYSINTYPAGSNGNVSPAATIAGADTGLYAPVGIALDSGGNLYVLNGQSGVTQFGSVIVYAAGSSGDAIPNTKITSNYTGINGPSSIALDSVGNIYVANELGGTGGSIDIYPGGSYATGPPIATIAGDNTELSDPFRIALDSSGNIFVLDGGGDYAITEYPAGSAGDAVPNATLNIDQSGKSSPTGMAVGRGGAVYIANQGSLNCNRRTCYQASPDSVAVYRLDSSDTRPIAVISGPNTQLASPTAIAVDHGGNIYVTNDGPLKYECGPGFCSFFSAGPGSVTVYAPGSNADVKPIATIGGIKTGIGAPYGIALDSNGNIYVLNDPSVASADPSVHPARKKGGVPVGGTVEVGEFGPNVEPILIFAADSDGDVAPIGSIGGRFTGLYGAAGIAVGPGGP
ncbi:MAG: NHL repeat-containing protein [Candidatus Binatus sp.]